MNFGGFLGMGEESHPIPWDKLSYDTSKGGYVTQITQAQLESAPQKSETWMDDTDYRDRSYRHYGADPYWV
jgi:hypothetical protein